MKPKAPTPHETGMLEYLEDIIGSNRFVDDIEAAATEVDGLNEIRGEKLNRLKSVEKEKDSLEGSKTEAEEFLRLEKELHANNAAVLQKHRAETSASVADTEAKKAELDEKLQAQKENTKALTDEEKDLAKRYKEVSKEYEATGQEMQEAKEKFAICERKDIARREELKHSKAKVKKITAAKDKEEEKLKKLSKQIEADTNGIAAKEAEAEAAQQAQAHEQGVLDKMFAGLQEETEPFRIKLEKENAKLEPLEKEVVAAKSTFEVADAELKLLTERIESGSKGLETAFAEKADMESRIETANVNLAKYQKSLDAAQKKLAKTSAELVQVNVEEAGTNTSLKSGRSTLEEQRRSQESTKSRNALLSALMEAQSNGKLTGILGRLGDLGTIAEEYDVAITTACPQLNFIVAETAKAAQMAVALMKKNKLGVATFLMLDSIQVSGKNMVPQSTPEDCPRLFDLVRPADEKIRPAFYKALGDTLVAADLEQASRIAYGSKRKQRVVTLEGQMIEASGTMSGGGAKAKKGGMSSRQAVPASDLVALEKEVSASTERLTKLRNSQRDLVKAEKALQTEISDLEFELKRAEMEAGEVQKSLQLLLKTIADLESQGTGTVSKDDEARQKELQKEVTKHQATLAKTEKAAAPLRAAIAKLKDEMLAVGGNKLEKQKNKVEGLEKKVDELNTELSKLQVGITAAKKQIATAEKALATKTKELEETHSAIADAEKEIKEIEDGAFEVLQAYKEAEANLAEKHKEVAVLEKDYEEKKALLEGIKTEEVDITNQLDDCKRVMKESQKKTDQWTAQLRKLRKEAAYEAESSQQVAPEEEKVPEEVGEATEEGEATPSEEASPKSVSKKDLVLKGLVDDLSEEELERFDMDDLFHEINVVTAAMQSMKPNMGAIEEYRKKERDYNERMAELDTVTETRDAAKAKLESLRKQRLDAFMAGFAVISMKLKEMYQMITMGGDAELELVDSLDPFSEGIVFSVRPPKKSWKNITNLSGGEKTLSSLALVFALHHYKPTPLYVMDEIDAALDFKNVSIVANYVKDRTKNAQFIIISLRNNMFELANRLVGIYKTNDATKSITIDPSKFVIGENVAKAAPSTA